MVALCILVFTIAISLEARAAEPDLNQREEDAIRAAVNRVAPSVVRIQTVGGMDMVEGMSQASGPATGLVVSPAGLIISSAYNFARKPSAILVTIGDRKNIPAKLLATDHSRALVLLKIEVEPGETLVVPEAAPTQSAVPGAWAIAVGRTIDQEHPNVSVGIVSAVGRVWSKAVQTDAKISPANYGGPLIDIHGRVLGVLAPMSPMSAGEAAGAEWYDSGIGFAVPLTDIDRVLPELGEGRDLHTGMMGLALKGQDLFAAPAVIAACRPGTPAYEAGLRRGDRIVAAAGKSVVNQAQLKHIVGPLYAGDTLELTVERDKKQIDAKLTLVDKLPPYRQALLGVLPLRGAGEQKGVPVRFLLPNSAAEKTGLRSGDVIEKIDGHEVKDAAAAREILVTLGPEQEVPIVIRRDGQSQTVTARLTGPTEAIPDNLPAPRADNKKPAAGTVIDVRIAELPNKCFAYVPAPTEPASPPGLLIDIAPAGQFDKDQTVARWKDYCDRTNTILLLPRPRGSDKWQPDELELIVRAAGQLDDKYGLDRARIAAVGRQGGGAMALLAAFTRVGMLKGVAAIDASIPHSVQPQPLEPPVRLAVLVARAAAGPVSATLGRQIPQLRELGYPVTEFKLPRSGGSLDEGQQRALERWLDGLDQF